MFRRAAVFVDKILKNAEPPSPRHSDRTADKFRTVVNLKMAKAIGVDSTAASAGADEVIE